MSSNFNSMKEKQIKKTPEFYLIGKVKVSITSQDSCIENIISEKGNNSKYICVGNVRTAVLGNRDEKYQNTINRAFMNLPDGMPLVWAGRIAGANAIKRTSGPDLFSELLKDKYGLKHYFLGDTEDTLQSLTNKIKIKYPKTIISGHYSPPFGSIENFDIRKIAKIISDSDANIIWVAIGAPKQDYLSAELVNHCEKGIFIGVGAAFRFFLGEYKHPPRIFQLLGLEGIFWRFTKNPINQFIWYVKHIPQYIWLLTKLKLPDTS